MSNRSALALVVVLSQGCSLMGLDEAATTPCLQGAAGASLDFTAANRLCAEQLAQTQTLSSCEAFVCGLKVGEEYFCTVGAPDADGDGAGDAMCLPDGAENADCNESDPAVFAARSEICDGKDNDCDGAVDDGFLVAGDRETVAQSILSAAQLNNGEIVYADTELLAFRVLSTVTVVSGGSVAATPLVASDTHRGNLAVARGAGAVWLTYRPQGAEGLKLVRRAETTLEADVFEQPIAMTVFPKLVVTDPGGEAILVWRSETDPHWFARAFRVLNGQLSSTAAVDLGAAPSGSTVALTSRASRSEALLALNTGSQILIRELSVERGTQDTLSVRGSTEMNVAGALEVSLGSAAGRELLVWRTADRVAAVRLHQTAQGEVDGVDPNTEEVAVGTGLSGLATVFSPVPMGWVVAVLEQRGTTNRLRFQLLGATSGLSGEPSFHDLDQPLVFPGVLGTTDVLNYTTHLGNGGIFRIPLSRCGE